MRISVGPGVAGWHGLTVLKVALALALLPAFSAGEVTLEQVISREHPAFGPASSRLNVGKDGLVYLGDSGRPGYVMRMARDGSGKAGFVVTYALTSVAANANGMIATSHGHFSHSISLFDAGFHPLSTRNDFVYGDGPNKGWNAPISIQAGDGGDFYAVDQYANQVICVDGNSRTLAKYRIAEPNSPLLAGIAEFRVCERASAFIWQTRAELVCTGFDGNVRWVCKSNSPFDVDANGLAYVYLNETVRVIADGNVLSQIKLSMGEHKPTQSTPVVDLKVSGGDVLLRRKSPSELFQVYSLADGGFKNAVNADVERLTVTIPSETWLAGATLPLGIHLDGGGRTVLPFWRVYLRPYGQPQWDDMAVTDGNIAAPGRAGLYQLRVCPSTSGDEAEYLVQTFVEVRPMGSSPVAAVIIPPDNRRYFGRGEAISVQVVWGGDKGPLPKTVRVDLLGETGAVATAELPVEPNAPSAMIIPAQLTGALREGVYRLDCHGEGVTGIGRTLELGPGIHGDAPFHTVQYGDYGATHPEAKIWNAPETVDRFLHRNDLLGINLHVDRLGLGRFTQFSPFPDATALAKRLAGDANGLVSSLALTPALQGQVFAGYSALGVQQMAILVGMDGGLPIGTSYDARTREQFAADIAKATGFLKSYPAFRGWSWAANWWVGQLGEKAADSNDQRDSYRHALKDANDTGRWSAVLDQVSDVVQGHAVAGQAFFNSVLHTLAPDAVTASSGAYRNVSVYPPVTFSNVEEVDLHYQGEQISPPQIFPHDVDFQKRPLKRAFGHPELWNDAGTGEQIVPTLMQMVMRGADGVGCSGNIPNWSRPSEDPRDTLRGAPSEFRSLNGVLRMYGPWLASLHGDDDVAIVASRRMFRIDNWGKGIGGQHFTRLYEAYQACLYAHRPARFAFVEDLGPEELTRFKAVLVIDQRVELEKEFASALTAALKAGVKVFYDDASRPELLPPGCAALGVRFDRVENDPSTWQDDAAYIRFPRYFMDEAAALEATLGQAVPPLARVMSPQVLLSRRASGQGRVLFVVNNTTPLIEPGLLWRATLASASRLPVVAEIDLHLITGEIVYDVLASRPVSTGQVPLQADLRTMPARIYAVLPVPIAAVKLSAPAAAAMGQAMAWSATIVDEKGNPIDASVPLAVRLVAPDGQVLSENYTFADSKPAAGNIVVPMGRAVAKVTLEACELLSRRTARIDIAITPSPKLAPVQIVKSPGDEFPATLASPMPATAPAESSVVGSEQTHWPQAAERSFGPHLRDLAISADGTEAVLNAMNWENNLYSVDVATGQLKWTRRIGRHFAYGPLAAGAALAVQGFDFATPEGYHLYLLDRDGNAQNRFALYGLPNRRTAWLCAGMLADRPGGFALSPDGAWVASAGNLGLAVWTAAGTPLWRQDLWKDANRTVPGLLALDANTLLVLDGPAAAAYSAADGRSLWRLDLAAPGELAGAAALDGTLVLRADTLGGRLFAVRDGKLTATLITDANSIAVRPGGREVLASVDRELKLYSLDKGLQWTFSGDDVLHNIRFSPDGRRLVAASEIGTLYVLDANGRLLHRRDMGAIASAAWLAGGDLVVGNWKGDVFRLDANLAVVWSSRLAPAETDVEGKLLARDDTPTVRIDGWGNALPTPLPLGPNLIRQAKASIRFVWEGGREIPPQNDPNLLTDGDASAPARPWIDWTSINYIDSGWRGPLYVEINSGKTLMSVEGITFVEDGNNPQSWLRDVKLEYWDGAAEHWVGARMLLSNAAVHSHAFDKPVTTTRLRLSAPTTGQGSWPVGNIRLGELVLHGKVAP